jgi:hypothetical protein
MSTHTIEIRIADMPEVIFALRRELAKVLKREAEAETDPTVARRLYETADKFEIGQ